MLCFLGKVEGVSRGIAVRSFVFGRSYSSTILFQELLTFTYLPVGIKPCGLFWGKFYFIDTLTPRLISLLTSSYRILWLLILHVTKTLYGRHKSPIENAINFDGQFFSIYVSLGLHSDVTLTPTDGRWRYALPIGKGQLISKVIYGLLSSPKKQTDKFVLFAFFTLHGKQIKFVRSFLGESTAS